MKFRLLNFGQCFNIEVTFTYWHYIFDSKNCFDVELFWWKNLENNRLYNTIFYILTYLAKISLTISLNIKKNIVMKEQLFHLTNDFSSWRKELIFSDRHSFMWYAEVEPYINFFNIWSCSFTCSDTDVKRLKRDYTRSYGTGQCFHGTKLYTNNWISLKNHKSRRNIISEGEASLSKRWQLISEIITESLALKYWMMSEYIKSNFNKDFRTIFISSAIFSLIPDYVYETSNEGRCKQHYLAIGILWVHKVISAYYLRKVP